MFDTSAGETTESHSDEGVTVVRDAEPVKGGYLFEYSLTSDAEDPIVVGVTDVVDAEDGLADYRFKPDEEPMNGDVTDEVLEFKEVVLPTRSTSVVCALKPVGENVTATGDPTIEYTTKVNGFEDAGDVPEESLAPEAADHGEATGGSSGLYSKVSTVLDYREEDESVVSGTGSTGEEQESDVGAEPIPAPPVDGPVGSAEADEGEKGSPPPEGTTSTATEAVDTTSVQSERAADTAGEPSDDVVEQLVAAIEEEDLEEDQRETVREGLGFDRPRSEEVQIQHLQRRVEEFAAYAGAMEALIDEHGTSQEFLDDVNARLADLDAETAQFRDDLESIRESQESLADDLATVEECIDEVRADVFDRIDEVETGLLRDVAAVERDVSAEIRSTTDLLRDDLEELDDSVASDLAELRTEVEDLATRMDSDIGDIHEEFDRVRANHERAIETIATDLDELETSLTDDVESVRSDHQSAIDDLRSDYEEAIASVRERIDEDVDHIHTMLESLESDLSETEDGLSDDLAELRKEVDELETMREALATALQSSVDTTATERGEESAEMDTSAETGDEEPP